MNITLKQLREIDNELVVDGNMVYLQDKVEYINYKFGYFSEDVNRENVRDFYFDNMDAFDNDNGGIIYSENFQGVVDEDLPTWENAMANSNTTDDKLVVVYNIAASMFPIVVEFPSDVINEDEVYEVDYWCEEGVKTFDDYEYYEDEYIVA